MVFKALDAMKSPREEVAQRPQLGEFDTQCQAEAEERDKRTTWKNLESQALGSKKKIFKKGAAWSSRCGSAGSEQN